MKAAGYALTVNELVGDLVDVPNVRLFIQVDGGAVPIVESESDGTMSTADELYDQSYTEAHELLEQIAEDPKVWTKKKIMEEIKRLGYGA